MPRLSIARSRRLAPIGVLALLSALVVSMRRTEAERRRLAATIASLGDAVIVTEPGSTTIAAVNPRASILLPELAPRGRVDADHSPLPPLRSALAAEITIEHRGRSLGVTAAPLGHPSSGIVWTVRDVTERARRERTQSEFVATAAHELRSPLTSIKGFVELLERSPEQMSERQRGFVDIILRSTDRLVELVNDLLDVARIDAQQLETSHDPIDVGEAVHEIAESMGARIADKRQVLVVYVAPGLPLALADPARIRQIIANLLTNAHQYTGAEGRIDVRAESERAWVRISVADSGVGMTPDEVGRAFERFYRGAHANAPTPGTGLGLSIVKSLVDLQHGEIEVESEPGRGTTFRVRLPAAVSGPDAGRSLEPVSGRRVLIVDDERDVAELVAGQLAPLDVRTTIVTSGEAAISALRAERYDAITLDILMPGMDGFEVLRQIRADPGLRPTPIVFVSVVSERQELAGEWMVSKPISAPELRDVLSAALRAGRTRVLVVARETMWSVLAPALDELGIEHQWETTGAAAARVSGERRFEVALIDVGTRNPQAILQALELRGRRLRRAVILVSDGATPTPPSIGRLGMEVVAIEDAPQALLDVLRGQREDSAD